MVATKDKSKRKYGGLLTCPLCAHILSNYIDLEEYEQLNRKYSSPLKCPLAKQLKNDPWLDEAKLSLTLCDLHQTFKSQYDFLTYCKMATQKNLRISTFKSLGQVDKGAYIEHIKQYVFDCFNHMKKVVHQRLVQDAKKLVQRWTTHVDKVAEECQNKAAELAKREKEELSKKKQKVEQQLEVKRLHYGRPLLLAFESEPKLQMARDFETLQILQQEAKEIEATERRAHFEKLAQERKKRVAYLERIKQKTLESQYGKLQRMQEKTEMTSEQANEKLKGRLAIAMTKLEGEQVDEWHILQLHFREHLNRVEHFIDKIVTTGTSTSTGSRPLYQSPTRVSFKSEKAPDMVPAPVMEFAVAVLEGEMRVLEHKKYASAPPPIKRPQSAAILYAQKLTRNLSRARIRPQTADGTERCDMCAKKCTHGLMLDRDDLGGSVPGSEARPLATCCSKVCLLKWNNLYSPPYMRHQREARIEKM